MYINYWLIALKPTVRVYRFFIFLYNIVYTKQYICDALLLQWHRNRKVEKIFPWKIGLNVLDVVRGHRIINISVCVLIKLWKDERQCMQLHSSPCSPEYMFVCVYKCECAMTTFVCQAIAYIHWHIRVLPANTMHHNYIDFYLSFPLNRRRNLTRETWKAHEIYVKLYQFIP